MIRHPVVVAGARPNFPKVAPLLRAFSTRGIEAALVHTGQHYDAAMSAAFFESLDIPEPVANFGVGSGTHAAQTAAVMVAFEEWLNGAGRATDAVLVAGDVNSTVACALVAAKAGIPVGHVEAGLRSFDRTMPEEINRIVVDSLSTWLFTPSADADDNLRAEGVEAERIRLVGNIMVDSLFAALEPARRRSVRADLGLPDEYGLVTLHRPALVDDPDRLGAVMSTLHEVAMLAPLVFPVHPRTRKIVEGAGVAADSRLVRLIEPLGYLDFLALQASATLVLTDSGGVQEETTVLGVPCLTLRENTERPITVTRGTNTLVGFDRDAIIRAAQAAVATTRQPMPIPLWDGHTAERIVDVLCEPVPDVRFIPPALIARPSPEFSSRRPMVTP